jgi:hypothetical protein
MVKGLMLFGSLVNTSKCPQEFTKNKGLKAEVKWNSLWFNEESESDRMLLKKITSRKPLLKLDSILTNRIR